MVFSEFVHIEAFMAALGEVACFLLDLHEIIIFVEGIQVFYSIS